MVQREYFSHLNRFQKAKKSQKDLNMKLFNILLDLIENRKVSTQKFVKKIMDFIKTLIRTAQLIYDCREIFADNIDFIILYK